MNLTMPIVITMASLLSFTAPIPAQTADPYLNELLRQTDQLIQDSHRTLNETALPARQQLDKNHRNVENCRKYNQNDRKNQRGNLDESNPSQSSHY